MTQENKDIQPQVEPYIVKSHDVHIDADYADWIADIKSRYRSAQVKAAVKVNAEKLLFNWQLGRDLVQKKAEERWGAGVVEQVSLDLNREFPDSTNFSVRNLWYMKQWYMFYAENPEKLKQLVSVMLPDDNHDKIIKQIEDGEKLKQSVSEFPLLFACVPWGHHVRIVQHSKTIGSNMNRADVQWSFKGISTPMGVVTYNNIRIKDALPSQEQLAERVRLLQKELQETKRLMGKVDNIENL